MTLLMRDQENREEGEHDARVECAEMMLSDGMDYKTVAKYSGLLIEEVEELVKLQTV